jgi:small conductance mechanosensitive channel
MENLSEFNFIQNILNSVSSWMLEHGLFVALILAAYLLIIKNSRPVIERFVRKLVPPNKNEKSTGAERKREDTLIRILYGTIRIAGLVITVLMILSDIGVNIAPLIAAAGVLGLALGFGGQYLIKDFISGFFIILENQYRIGDVVCFEDTCGLVEDISLRATVLRNLDGTVHHVPHGSVLRVSNLSKQFARVNLDLGVSYGANLEQVISVINETGLALSQDEKWRKKILKPISFERVENFAGSAVIVKVLGETVPLEQWAVAGEFRKRIKIAFDAAGIEIPFPQIVVHKK